MPNWIQGSLKVRGPYDYVKRFLLEGLNTYHEEFNKETNRFESHVLPKTDWLEDTHEYDEHLGREFSMYIKVGKWIYVEGTQRAFITSDYISCYEGSNEKDPLAIVSCEVRQAWGFRPEDWIEISKDYQVDIRLYGFERGLEFGEEIEIVDGEVIKNEEFTYDNWDWDCPFPWFGG